MKRSVVSAIAPTGARAKSSANNPAIRRLLDELPVIAPPADSLITATLRDPFQGPQWRSLTQRACRAGVAGLRRFADSRSARSRREHDERFRHRLCLGARIGRALPRQEVIAGG